MDEILPSLPATPYKFYRPDAHLIGIAAGGALLVDYWNAPLPGAATDGAEFGFRDEVYWFYKSARPITKPEEGARDLLNRRDNSVVSLPRGFEKECTVSMGVAGDLIQAEGLEQSKNVLFSTVADVLFEKDISFANYESVVAQDEVAKEALGDGRSFTMCCSKEQYSTLTQHNGEHFTVLNTANNHTFDLDLAGLETTQKLLEQDGIVNVGTPRNVEEHGRGTILTSKGIKIGFVSATFGIRRFKLPPHERHRIHVAKLCSKYVAPELELLKRQITDCKAQGCDFIVGSLHWGWEFEFFPRESQIKAAHAVVEAGIDLLLGHHPHVIQPVEFYPTVRDPKRIAVIAYSLGSTTFGWFTAPHMMLSLMLNVELAKGTLDGAPHTYISAAKPVPVFRHHFMEAGKLLMRIEKLADHVSPLGKMPPSVQKMNEYAKLVLGDSYAR
ncbi:CapA family protein (plasmid) [Mesorhizobium sp. B2-1-8]|uniref:CapA family protein n=1 Tax=Mesorhizobium sp. B2-1-8 TaxID=2589967 RepID=UPI00112E3D5D|nr:CapA family protein [Mesorhizobium sp. B2-1-8]UCI22993.1 CapA family protein [Mesorhizobium sp. B2-1-8]